MSSVTKRLRGGWHTSSSNWWESENFEIELSTTSAWSDHKQIYASVLETDHTNADLICIENHNNGGTWTTVSYKFFLSYERLNELYSLNCNQNSTLYFWCGFATRGGWTQCSSFGNTAQLKITNNGIVKATDGSANYTSYNHRHGGWNSTSEWATVSDGLAAGNRVTMSIHMNGALTESGVINPSAPYSDYNWRTILPIYSKDGSNTNCRVFRLDWWSFKVDGGIFNDSDVDNGTEWTDTNLWSNFYNTILDCNIAIAFEHKADSDKYYITYAIFPTDPSTVDQDSFVLMQSTTISETSLKAYISAEWANFEVYNQ